MIFIYFFNSNPAHLVSQLTIAANFLSYYYFLKILHQNEVKNKTYFQLEILVES